MNTKQGARSYVDFEPSYEWSRGEETDILRVHLPDFKREYIKVQVDSYGNLRTAGERPVEGNQWSRFWKDFRLPNNCNVSDIRAKFENGTLFITVPKQIARSKPTVPDQLPPLSKPAPAPAPKPVAAPEMPKPAVPEPKPTADQPSIASPRYQPANGKLRDMLSTKQEEKVDDKKSTTPTQPVGEKKETDRKEEKPIEEKRTEKQPITQAAGSSSAKETVPQASRVATGLQSPRRGLLLNVAVAVIVLVGLGLYLSFKLKKGVADHGYHNNTEEL
ncbi:hypothetical protein LUZ61_015057 [Rhynchospora tenuis]|uniref:SHSP domain-containing protein n=1 Tax=Rhynchospora tenuis TaxID=198213 RepID=A0AAD5WFN2_9POAL|nr:hypothetical protein LUZ61_015057 [Rhynchospora tenuis]